MYVKICFEHPFEIAASIGYAGGVGVKMNRNSGFRPVAWDPSSSFWRERRGQASRLDGTSASAVTRFPIESEGESPYWLLTSPYPKKGSG